MYYLIYCEMTEKGEGWRHRSGSGRTGEEVGVPQSESGCWLSSSMTMSSYAREECVAENAPDRALPNTTAPHEFSLKARQKRIGYANCATLNECCEPLAFEL
jgi:hypothetical protein